MAEAGDAGSQAQRELFTRTSRNWVFTWNNYPTDAFARLEAQRALFAACFVGQEVGSGTPHLQGVLVSRKPCRMAALRRLFPHVHFDVMRGTEKQAVDYTKKEGGERLDWDDRAQGSRTDLAAMCAAVQANPRVGVRVVAATMSASFVKYHAGVTALARHLQPVPAFFAPRNVKWFWGATGTGKSYTALQEALSLADDEHNVFRWTVHNLKFPGSYNGEQYVVLDELRSDWEHFTFARLLTLLDAYRCEVEVKGGQMFWAATHVWVTTPLFPDDFITDTERRGNPNATRQLRRRIGQIREFTEFYEPPTSPPPPDVCEDSAPEDTVPTQLVTAHVGTPPLQRAGAFRIPPESESTDTEGALARMRAARVLALPSHQPIVPDDSSDDPIVEAYFYDRA